MKKIIILLVLGFWASFKMLGQPAGYTKLVFSDEFEGDLDYSKWTPEECVTHSIGGPECEEAMFYMPGNVTTVDGKLRLTAREQTVTCGTKTKLYTSGQVRSSDFLYGYFEIKAKLPKGNGLWPAFWFWTGCSSDSYREIDILEACGCDCGEYKAGFYYENDYNGQVDPPIHSYQDISTSDLCTSYHKYGVEWTQDQFSFYFDGVKKFSRPNPNLNMPMPMILNLAVNGCYGGCGAEYCGNLYWQYNAHCTIDCNTILPESYLIDYVKIWKKNNEAVYILGPKEVCVGQTYKYFAPFFQDADYLWFGSNGLQINPLLNDPVSWSCNPPGVFRQVLVTPTVAGNHTLSTTVTFPSGYVETKSITIQASLAAPNAPIMVNFVANADDCCYYPQVNQVAGATHYTWSFDGQSFVTTSNTADLCLPPGDSRTVRVSAGNGCGESETLIVSQFLPEIPECNMQMRLSPNPASTSVKVEIVENGQQVSTFSGTVQVRDSFDNIKIDSENFIGEKTLDVASFAVGVYRVIVQGSNKVLQQNFIKNSQ